MMRLPRWMDLEQEAGSLRSAVVLTAVTVGLVAWGAVAPDTWAAWIPAGWFFTWAVLAWAAYVGTRRGWSVAESFGDVYYRFLLLLAILFSVLAVTNVASGFGESDVPGFWWFLAGAMAMAAVLYSTAYVRSRRTQR